MDAEEPDRNFAATLVAAKAGDSSAVNELFQLFYPRVKSLVHKSLALDLRNSRPWLTARFSTGDVVQEVFRSVLGDLSSFGGTTEKAFTGYLTMVVRNRIIDAIRFHEADRRDGRRGAAPLPEDEHPSDAAGPVSEVANAEEIDRFHEALAGFPEREQLLLRARFEETASFAELTEQLGYPSESTARRAYFAAQAKLAVQLRSASMGDTAAN
ncbi:RNA polymerase sigma factor [Planctomycetes bacterium Poly30]|uniref:RNA polymerase sigma factor n=1 Tax=Saltatorellus ferox TaxID=2528018 RepID=A0A518EZU0_9BACT|nr:RNA polymerase sigma factor [Planctomycetes bacterium Poly30]